MTGTHVLYVLKRFPRLSETFVLRELLSLEAAGITVSVDALLPPEDEPRHPELCQLVAPVRYVVRHPRLRSPRVAAAHARVAVRSPRRWVLGALRAGRAGAWRRFLQGGLVADRAQRERVGHLHAHFATAAADVAKVAAGLTGLPFTVTAHAKDIYQTDNADQLRARVAGARAVLTVSRFNVEHLRSVLPGTPVHLVPNGVAVEEPLVASPSGPVLCVARLVAKKGIDLLIEAIGRLPSDLDDLRVEIVGDGALAEALSALARESGVADRVDFLGSLPSSEVDAAYRRCSMVVLPCRVTADGDRDGMPTVLLEALARGLPVVTTDVVGIAELVQHETSGLLAPPDDAGALAAAITRLARDPALGRSLGAAGRALVATDYAPERSTRLLLDVVGQAR